MSHLDTYKKAMPAGREIDCYNNKIIFCERDSFMIGLTDDRVLWCDCILPLYEEGDHDLPNRIKQYVQQLANTDDIVSVYGALMTIHGYILTSAFYGKPFEIDFSDCIDIARKTIQRNEEAFKNYQGNKFSSYIGNPYELVAEMVGLNKPVPQKARPVKKKTTLTNSKRKK